jgi:hypothetical protein
MDTISVSPAGSRLPSGLNPAPSQVRVSELVGGEDIMFRILLSVAMAVMVAASAHAQQPAAASRLDDIIKRGALRVGMTGDYLPFTYLDKSNAEISRLRRRHGGSAGQGARRQGRICPDRLAATHERL